VRAQASAAAASPLPSRPTTILRGGAAIALI
jgi:hypothetical protein